MWFWHDLQCEQHVIGQALHKPEVLSYILPPLSDHSSQCFWGPVLYLGFYADFAP